MRWTWLMVLAGAVVLAMGAIVPAQAEISQVWIEPADPEVGDVVVFHIAGHFTDGCWQPPTHSVSRDGNTFSVQISAVDGWRPELACITVIVDYVFTDTLGALATGSYAVNVAEHHESLRDPLSEHEQITFTVREEPEFCLCLCHADIGCDGLCDVMDVVQAVSVAFRGTLTVKAAACPYFQTDVNCDGVVDAIDIVRFINVAFRNTDAATEFCAGCGD